MLLLIDNYDSFTYNLAQLLAGLGVEVAVRPSDAISVQEVGEMSPSYIVISPGPKRPEQAGISMELIRRYHQEIPILGVCLGHQAIGQVFGAEVVHAKQLMHGKTSAMLHDGKGVFTGVPDAFRAARYHSLALASCPTGFTVRAKTEDGEIMAIQHETLPVYGVQFHPESFMTEHGDVLLKNFLARL